eukprot:PRCOL_00002152-RA
MLAAWAMLRLPKPRLPDSPHLGLASICWEPREARGARGGGGDAYRRGALLGRGSYGRVYAATHLHTGERAVIKELELAGASAAERQEALNEAKLLQGLSHPRLVVYRESYVASGRLHIVMERAPGGDLAAALRAAPGGAMDEARVWHYLAQVAEGLTYLHSRRVLHRDIKPSNVFLDARGDAIIGDLGLSRALGAESAFAETGVGTPLYYSPELCEGRPYDARTDVWSLGCLAYELATGAPPFSAPNALALARKIVGSPAKQLPHTFSAEMRFLVSRMLEKDASKRPSAAAVLAMSPVQLALERSRRRHAEDDLAAARKTIAKLQVALKRSEGSRIAAAKPWVKLRRTSRGWRLPRPYLASLSGGAALVGLCRPKTGRRRFERGHPPLRHE